MSVKNGAARESHVEVTADCCRKASTSAKLLVMSQSLQLVEIHLFCVSDSVLRIRKVLPCVCAGA